MKTLVTVCVLSLIVTSSSCAPPGEELNGTWSVVGGGFTPTQSLEIRYVFSARSGETGVYRGSIISKDTSDSCQTTTSATGSWSASSDTLTRTITGGDSVTTGCTDSSKNVAMKSETVADLNSFGLIFSGSYGWAVKGDELTLTKLSDVKPEDKPSVMKRVK